MKRLLSLITLLQLVPLSLEPETTWALSNKMGMVIAPLASRPHEKEKDWFLEIERTAHHETRTLWKGWREFKRWEQEKDEMGKIVTEVLYRERLAREKRRYDAKGRVLEERVYGAEGGEGALTTTKIYQYGPYGLETVLTRDEKGSLLYTDRYHIRSDGSLYRVERTSQEETLSSMAINRLGIHPSRGVLQEANTLQTVFYDDRGRIIRRNYLTEDGFLSRIDRYLYSQEGGLVQKSILHRDRQEETIFFYNDKGLPTRKEQSRKETLLFSEQYRYDDEGYLIMKERSDRDGNLAWFYTYDEEKRLREESLFRDAELRERLLYTDKGEITRLSYHKGELLPFSQEDKQ